MEEMARVLILETVIAAFVIRLSLLKPDQTIFLLSVLGWGLRQQNV